MQQIKLQSTTTNNNDALNSTNKFNMVSFYSTDNKKDSSNAGGESLEKKLLGINSARAINPFNIYLKEKYKSTIESNPSK